MMIFKDAKDRSWVISYDFRKMCRIEDELGIKVLDDPTNLPVSPRKYVEMAWIAIEDQAKEAGVTPEDFGGALNGSTYAELQKSVVLELAVFFEAPRPGASVLMRKAVELNDQAQAVGVAAVEKVFDEASSKLQEQLGSLLGTSQPGS